MNETFFQRSYPMAMKYRDKFREEIKRKEDLQMNRVIRRDEIVIVDILARKPDSRLQGLGRNIRMLHEADP